MTGRTATMPPKKLKGREDRRQARRTRDSQWKFMERAKEHDPLWFCVWNKTGQPELADEWRDGLITGMEMMEWMQRHPTWFKTGRWSDKRYARPIRLTPAGRRALKTREFDMEPIYGGLVEPGWQCIPARPKTEKV